MFKNFGVINVLYLCFLIARALIFAQALSFHRGSPFGIEPFKGISFKDCILRNFGLYMVYTSETGSILPLKFI